MLQWTFLQALISILPSIVINDIERKNPLSRNVWYTCLQYFEGMGLSEEEIQKRLQTCSRHRAKHAAPGTPEHFWDIGMEDTLECEERGQFLYTNTHTQTLTNTESLMQYTQMVVEGDKTLKLTYKGKLIFVKNLHRILFVFHQDMWTQRIQMKASRGSGGKDNWIKCLNLKKRKKDETRGSNSGNHLNNLHVYQYVISGTRKYFSKTCWKLT